MHESFQTLVDIIRIEAWLIFLAFAFVVFIKMLTGEIMKRGQLYS